MTLPPVKGNCTKLQRFNGIDWDTISKRVSISGPGLSRETVEEEITLDCDPSGGNPFKKKSPGTKEIGDISIDILWNPVTPTGTHQVTTATGAGIVSGGGNALVTITAARLNAGAATPFNIPVTPGSPGSWIGEIRAFLSTSQIPNAVALRASYEVGGEDNKLTLKDTEPRANDATRNIALATGTATGITAAPTSAATIAGVAGEENDQNHHLFEDDFDAETATYWRIVHPNDQHTGVIVHATVKEVGEPSYEANQNVQRTIVIEPTGEFYKAANAIEDVDLPANLAVPQLHYGRH